MAEVLFYHLTATPLDRTLPDLLEKSLARGWRVLLRCGTQEGLAALDRA
ncbi:DNA polymerase III subunit chi, partial [Amaricoccus sp.]